jgi:hypothetical protein
VVGGLLFGQPARFSEKPVSLFGESKNAESLFPRDFDGFVREQRRLFEPPNVALHAGGIGAVGVFG